MRLGRAPHPQAKMIPSETRSSFRLPRLSFQRRSRSEVPGGWIWGRHYSTTHTHPKLYPQSSPLWNPRCQAAASLLPLDSPSRTPQIAQTLLTQSCWSGHQTPLPPLRPRPPDTSQSAQLSLPDRRLSYVLNHEASLAPLSAGLPPHPLPSEAPSPPKGQSGTFKCIGIMSVLCSNFSRGAPNT